MGDLNATENFFTSSDTDNLEVEELLYKDRNRPDVSYLHLVYMFLVQSFARPIRNAQVEHLMKRVYINTTLLARLLLIRIWTLRFLHPMKLVVWWNWMINMTKCVLFTILSNVPNSLLSRNHPAIVGPHHPNLLHHLSTEGRSCLMIWLLLLNANPSKEWTIS